MILHAGTGGVHAVKENSMDHFLSKLFFSLSMTWPPLSELTAFFFTGFSFVCTGIKSKNYQDRSWF